ncbi:class I SAM-dependent methyltransferase [Mycetocola sp. 2940]|uniref:class I SAM-dependent methyltransferase n=1 Tax=Mycetocola sp. 2940 TaxID=3156452 RepID=UPI00339A815D
MDDAGDAWSAVAAEWAELWGSFADPVRRAIVAATGIRAGTRVLDVGCGSGEFLGMVQEAGAVTAGIDPAPGMLTLARARVPAADIRPGSVDSLPWPAASFDVVTAVNALQFVDDPDAALAEMARVTVPGGFVAVANWADAARNDIHLIEQAVAASFDEELPPDDDLRLPGGLERLVRAGGLRLVASGTVPARWEAPDDSALVRGILLGEDSVGLAEGAGTVLNAARGFRMPGGGYRLENAFRFAVGRAREKGA